MRKLLPMLATLSLGGCVTVPADFVQSGAETAELTRLASASAETLVLSLGAGAAPDFAATQLAIERARLGVASRITIGVGRLGIEEYAGLGVLGATLTVCQDGVTRLQLLYANDPESASIQARTRFWPGCVLPLGLAAMQSRQPQGPQGSEIAANATP